MLVLCIWPMLFWRTLGSNSPLQVQLLREAVLAVAEESKDTCPTAGGQAIEEIIKSSKIPWKRVAERVARYGSYHFGNATCRKKWDELRGHSS